MENNTIIEEGVQFDRPGKEVELRMNGHTLTHVGMTLEVCNGTLRITGAAIIKSSTSQFYSELFSPAVVVNGGKLVFEDDLTAQGSIDTNQHSGTSAVCAKGGELEFNGGLDLNGALEHPKHTYEKPASGDNWACACGLTCEHPEGYPGGACPVCGRPCEHPTADQNPISRKYYCPYCGEQMLVKTDKPDGTWVLDTDYITAMEAAEDGSAYSPEEREVGLTIGPDAGTIQQLWFGNNQSGTLTKKRLSGGSYGWIYVPDFGTSIQAGSLLAEGYAF